MAPFVSAPFDRSRTPNEPALPSFFTPDAAASTASRPASLTIRIRPSVGQDGEGFIGDLGEASRRISENTKSFAGGKFSDEKGEVGQGNRRIVYLRLGRALPPTQVWCDRHVTHRGARLRAPMHSSLQNGSAESLHEATFVANTHGSASDGAAKTGHQKRCAVQPSSRPPSC